MSNSDILQQVKLKANQWLSEGYDADTRAKVADMLQNNEAELIECFYKDLEFGTGGLRGIMGVGTNRMNIYTVGMATQGLCNYLKMNFAHLEQIKVAIAHDCRNNGQLFAQTAANIFSANGIKVYLFDALRPTPELSFAIRYFGCQSGVVLTASHNPKEYNGFKAYWDDGAQLTNPHDENVVNEALKISVEDVKFAGNPDLIQVIGKEVDEVYLQKINELSLSPQWVAKHNDLKIVYTPIHGTGVHLVPMALKNYGFTNIITVAEQCVIDGNFPTVISPNPENAEALEMAIKKAKETGADLVMASDPDADRVGIAVRNSKGDFVLLNGNQTGAIITYYTLKRWKELDKLKGNEYIVKTIVTTNLISDIAQKFGVEFYNVLTGFKFIAEVIRNNEGKKTYITGGEESYGYLPGDFVRDKDAVAACALIAECAAYAIEHGKTMYDLLMDIYMEFGFYKEGIVNVVKKGKAGAEEIQQMMTDYRANPPKTIDGSAVKIIYDYQLHKEINTATGETKSIDLPTSNVLQFLTEDGTLVSVRPSGTEPKIKFYFSVKTELKNKESFEIAEKELDTKISNLIADLGLK